MLRGTTLNIKEKLLEFIQRIKKTHLYYWNGGETAKFF